MQYFCINFSQIFSEGGTANSPDRTPYPFAPSFEFLDRPMGMPWQLAIKFVRIETSAASAANKNF